MSIKFLAFAASTRREAFSRRVLPILVSGAREAGAEVVLADLADFSMPIYQGDEEAEHGRHTG